MTGLSTTMTKSGLTDLVCDLVKSVFRAELADLFEGKPLMFGDFMKRGLPYEQRQYDEVKDVATMGSVVMAYQEEYNP